MDIRRSNPAVFLHGKSCPSWTFILLPLSPSRPLKRQDDRGVSPFAHHTCLRAAPPHQRPRPLSRPAITAQAHQPLSPQLQNEQHSTRFPEVNEQNAHGGGHIKRTHTQTQSDPRLSFSMVFVSLLIDKYSKADGLKPVQNPTFCGFVAVGVNLLEGTLSTSSSL